MTTKKAVVFSFAQQPQLHFTTMVKRNTLAGGWLWEVLGFGSLVGLLRFSKSAILLDFRLKLFFFSTNGYAIVRLSHVDL